MFVMAVFHFWSSLSDDEITGLAVQMRGRYIRWDPTRYQCGTACFQLLLSETPPVILCWEKGRSEALLCLLPKDLSQAKIISAEKPPQHLFLSGIFLMASVKLQRGEQDTETCQLHLWRLDLEAQALKAVSVCHFHHYPSSGTVVFCCCFFDKNEEYGIWTIKHSTGHITEYITQYTIKPWQKTLWRMCASVLVFFMPTVSSCTRAVLVSPACVPWCV